MRGVGALARGALTVARAAAPAAGAFEAVEAQLPDDASVAWLIIGAFVWAAP